MRAFWAFVGLIFAAMVGISCASEAFTVKEVVMFSACWVVSEMFYLDKKEK